MYKKLTFGFLLGSALFLTACSDSDTSDTSNEDEAAQENSDDSSGEESYYELGETIDLESLEWDATYQITAKSMDVRTEYNGEAIGDFVLNAPEEHKFIVIDTVIKNTSDEPMIPGEYVVPRLETEPRGAGDQFIFEFSEDELSQELAPGEEVELDFVFNESLYPDVENLYYNFEALSNLKAYQIPVP